MKTRFPRPITGVWAILLLLAGGRSAFAHAVLVRSFPADQSTMHKRDVNVVLDYDSRIDTRRSKITVTRADGQLIPLSIEASGKPFELKAAANGLANGHYTIHWEVLASDGHITRGDVDFTVAVK